MVNVVERLSKIKGERCFLGLVIKRLLVFFVRVVFSERSRIEIKVWVGL